MIQKLIEKIEKLESYPTSEDPGLVTEELYEKALEMEKAMDEFIQKCDLGLARSTYTYNLFKQILDK